MFSFLSWIAWNCELAALPVVLGYLVARIGPRAAARGGAAWCGFGALLVLWLLFLPNTCYLFTEWRHFLEFVDDRNLAGAAHHDPALLLEIANHALFYFFYAGFGALTLTFALRPVERLLRAWHVAFPLLAPALFLLLSIGVYLGLKVRFNSWDAVTHPLKVWRAIAIIPTSHRLMSAIIVFALLLWAVYEALDLWVDAFIARCREMAGKPAKSR